MPEAFAAETLARPLLPPAFDRQQLAEELVDAAVAALRQGTLGGLVRQRPRAARWMLRHARRLVQGVVGELLPLGETGLELQVRWLLHWAVGQLRPDQVAGLEGIPRSAWAGQAAWRPVLALACHAGLLAVAEMPERYRRRPGESAADNLCGLWGVGPSTFYRCLDRAQAALARLSQQPLPVPMRLSLRAALLAELQRAGHWPDEPDAAARRSWHAARRQACEQAGDMAAALWHALQAGDAEAAVRCAAHRPAALAAEPEAEALLERVAAADLPPRARFDLWLARALIARTRQAPERELAACQAALRLAEAQGSELMRGEAFFALGRCHEARDGDRSRACYADSLRHLDAAAAEAPPARVQAARLQTLARLALTQVRRNEPSARATLDEADALLAALGGADELEALLAQAWGAYWRIGGEPGRAREAWMHALNVFERLGDQRSVLATYRNVMLLHAEARDLAQLEACAQRIFAAAELATLEPAILIGAHGNLGYGYGLAERYDRAIHHFRESLALAIAARSDLEANRARCNLADVCYYQFLKTGDPALEVEADDLVAQVLRAPESAVTPTLLETARGLKAYVLGQLPQQSVDRVLDDEAQVHLEAMAAIRRHRAALAVGASGRDRAVAQVGIARAYLDIADREREAAFALAETLGLANELASQLQALRAYLGVQAGGPGALAERWRAEAADLLDEPRRRAVAERLLADGVLSKASYGEAAGVAPATASKHLALLAERGLLVQTGRGPATRYRPPQAEGSPGP